MVRVPFAIQDLVEVAIRCSDIENIFQFYRDILGLEVLSYNQSTFV
jgi:catechol 2,3-dioxygenase-like lactoylglutathione lyase family enzyme